MNEVGKTLSRYHVWNRSTGEDSYRVSAPSPRDLTIIWTLVIVLGLWILLVLTIGYPDRGIYPDPNLEGSLTELEFWGLLTLWAFVGTAMPLIWAKVGGKDGRNMILILIAFFVLAVFLYNVYGPSASAFAIGLPLGAAIEMTLWYRRLQENRRSK